MKATATFAHWVAQVSDKWPEEAKHQAVRAIMDTVACILAGAHDEAPIRVYAAVAPWSKGKATVMATTNRLVSPWAALINGTAAHALDYDDVLEPAAAHVSAVLVPALFALGEERSASGAAIIDAYLVGFEIMARLAESLNMAHYHRGWHTTLTLGTPAVAAACARLLCLDESSTQVALSLSTSMAGGFKRQFGTMTKPLHAGLAAKNGLLAAKLAAAGVTASDEPFEGDRGFLGLLAGPAAPGFEVGLSHLGEPLAMLEYGVWLKLYPCCASTHRPVDALLQLREEYGLQPDSATTIEALLPEEAMGNLVYTTPRNEMEARFSLPYCMAVALIDGELPLSAFRPTAIHRPEVQGLLTRVQMKADPAQPGNMPARGRVQRAIVNVQLKNGQTLSKTVTHPQGHPKEPLSDEKLAKKFRACAAAGVIPDKDSVKALYLLNDFRSLKKIQDLTRYLRSKE